MQNQIIPAQQLYDNLLYIQNNINIAFNNYVVARDNYLNKRFFLTPSMVEDDGIFTGFVQNLEPILPALITDAMNRVTADSYLTGIDAQSRQKVQDWLDTIKAMQNRTTFFVREVNRVSNRPVKSPNQPTSY